MKGKKVSLVLYPEQLEYVKKNGNVSQAIRDAIDQAMKDRIFKLTFARHLHSGWIHITVKANNETDLIQCSNMITRKLNASLEQPDGFADWYLYRVEEQDGEAEVE